MCIPPVSRRLELADECVPAPLRAEKAAATMDTASADAAFDALAAKPARLEVDGAGIGAVLRSLPQATGTGIRRPAAFAARRVDRRMASGEPVGVAGHG